MAALLQDLKVRGLKCTQIIDIGANAGHWSGMVQGIFPDAAFCLIEPQEEMRPQLEALCKQYPRMHYHLAGAGPSEGNMLLTVWDDLLGSSMLPLANEHAMEKGKQREVPILTIDGLLAAGKLQMPQLIKLDIQGFELEALKGAETTFGHTEVYILEVSMFPFDDQPNLPQFAEVINFMLARGYVVYDFGGFGRRPYDGALGQCDVCFVKQNGFLRSSGRWN
jgi:FkbM family methyltransferase